MLMGLGIGVIGLEAAFRLFGTVTDIAFNIWDPTIGLRRQPGSTGRYVSGDYVSAPYRFNAAGWNNPHEYVTSKPRGVKRVCIVGDSQVEALQVPTGQALFTVAEKLMSRADRAVEWYSFGASGWGTSQEYECIRRYVLDYHPDTVILLFMQNDPFDCSPYIGDIEPYYVSHVLGPSGELVLTYPELYEPSMLRRLASKSALVRYFMVQKQLPDKIDFWLSGKKIEGGVGQLPIRQRVAGIRHSLVPGAKDLTDEQRQQRTWDLIESLLKSAREECATHGAQLLVAFRGWSSEIDGPITGKALEVVPREKDPYCLSERASEMGRERVGPICEKLGIPYLDLTDALRDKVKATGKSHRFPDDNHYSQVGHEAAGEALAKWVEDIWSKQPAVAASGKTGQTRNAP